jgi:hypothetical protein
MISIKPVVEALSRLLTKGHRSVIRKARSWGYDGSSGLGKHAAIVEIMSAAMVFHEGREGSFDLLSNETFDARLDRINFRNNTRDVNVLNNQLVESIKEIQEVKARVLELSADLEESQRHLEESQRHLEESQRQHEEQQSLQAELEKRQHEEQEAQQSLQAELEKRVSELQIALDQFNKPRRTRRRRKHDGVSSGNWDLRKRHRKSPEEPTTSPEQLIANNKQGQEATVPPAMAEESIEFEEELNATPISRAQQRRQDQANELLFLVERAILNLPFYSKTLSTPGRLHFAQYIALYLIAHGEQVLVSVQYASGMMHVSARKLREKLLDAENFEQYTEFLFAASASRRGKHPRVHFLLDNVEIQEEARKWVRANTVKPGSPNMTVQNFCDYMNKELLPKALAEYASKCPDEDQMSDEDEDKIDDEESKAPVREKVPSKQWQLTRKTALVWLHKLGFEKKTYKSGQFFDGHEAEENVASRKAYLARMEQLAESIVRTMPTKELIEKWQALPISQRPFVELVHDESICCANDDESSAWVEEGKKFPKLKPKSMGKGIMLSAFISEVQGGVLRLEGLDDDGVVFLEYGKDVWWNSDRMIEQLGRVIDLAEKVFPWARLIFKFDQSSNHKAMAADALSVTKMNVGPGGAQPKMRNGLWRGWSQPMVDGTGEPKGLEQVLRERKREDGTTLYDEIQEEKKKYPRKSDLQQKLSECDDFRLQTGRVEELITSRGHMCIFYPKYHCELSPIERFWSCHKNWLRRHCDMKFSYLEMRAKQGLRAVCSETVRLVFVLFCFVLVLLN